MKPKILIIIDISYTKRDYKRLGIDTLKKKFNVFVFDFTKNFSKGLHAYKFSHVIYKHKGYYPIKSISSFTKLLKKHKFSNCINFVVSRGLKPKLLDILKKNKVPIILVQNGLCVEPGTPRTLVQNLHILSLKFTNKKRFLAFIKNQISKIRNRFIEKVPHFFYDKMIITGKIGVKHPGVGLNTKIIYAHSFDYDKYIGSFDYDKYLGKDKIPKLEIKKPYALYIDQYLPLHPDAEIYMEASPRCTPEKFYPALNNFFNIFEKKYNMDIIIAAHPKSDYESNPKLLDGRRIIRNKTMSLITDCEVVFAHSSVAIAYAVLYKKPIIFLLSNEYIRSFDNYTPAVSAKILNSTCFNIDDKNNNSKIQNINLFKVDKKKYKIYKDDYIKYPTKSNKSFWEIFNEKI